MKKIKLIIAAVAMLSLVSSSAAYADGFAAGEGLYVGAFVGMNTGIVQPKVATDTTNTGVAANNSHPDNTFEATEGGLALEGIEGGALVGYGYKMGDLYAGLEGEWAAGDTEFKLTSTTAITVSGQRNGTCNAGGNICTYITTSVTSPVPLPTDRDSGGRSQLKFCITSCPFTFESGV